MPLTCRTSAPESCGLCSYYYRYAGGALGTLASGYLEGSDPANPARRYNASLTLLQRLSPAAVWDSNNKSAPNSGFHPSGINVLCYDGSVMFLSSGAWTNFTATPTFPPEETVYPYTTYSLGGWTGDLGVGTAVDKLRRK